MTFFLILKGTASNFTGGSLKVPPGLSMFTLVFICILPAWPMRTCAFCLSCPRSLIVGVESISISISSIFLNLFLVSGGGAWSWFLIFFFFFCSWNWSMSTFYISCFIFWGSGCWGVIDRVFFSILGIVVFRVLIKFNCSFIRFINSSSIFLFLFECLFGFHLEFFWF